MPKLTLCHSHKNPFFILHPSIPTPTRPTVASHLFSLPSLLSLFLMPSPPPLFLFSLPHPLFLISSSSYASSYTLLSLLSPAPPPFLSPFPLSISSPLLSLSLLFPSSPSHLSTSPLAHFLLLSTPLPHPCLPLASPLPLSISSFSSSCSAPATDMNI